MQDSKTYRISHLINRIFSFAFSCKKLIHSYSSKTIDTSNIYELFRILTYWQEIVRGESAKFGLILEHIKNLTEVRIVSIYHPPLFLIMID